MERMASVLLMDLFGGERLVALGGEALDDAAGDGLGVQADPVEDRLALCVLQELLGDAVQGERRGDAFVGEQGEQGAPDAAHAAVVLDADHEPVMAGEVDQSGVERLDQRGSTTVTPMPWAARR